MMVLALSFEEFASKLRRFSSLLYIVVAAAHVHTSYFRHGAISVSAAAHLSESVILRNVGARSMLLLKSQIISLQIRTNKLNTRRKFGISLSILKEDQKASDTPVCGSRSASKSLACG